MLGHILCRLVAAEETLDDIVAKKVGFQNDTVRRSARVAKSTKQAANFYRM